MLCHHACALKQYLHLGFQGKYVVMWTWDNDIAGQNVIVRSGVCVVHRECVGYIVSHTHTLSYTSHILIEPQWTGCNTQCFYLLPFIKLGGGVWCLRYLIQYLSLLTLFMPMWKIPLWVFLSVHGIENDISPDVLLIFNISNRADEK